MSYTDDVINLKSHKMSIHFEFLMFVHHIACIDIEFRIGRQTNRLYDFY